jgi:hypothetical protein
MNISCMPLQRNFRERQFGRVACALDIGCRLTYTNGMPTRAAITLYDHGQLAVTVGQLGIEIINNGILANQGSENVPDADLPFTVPAGIEFPVTVSFGGAESATSCEGGWS